MCCIGLTQRTDMMDRGCFPSPWFGVQPSDLVGSSGCCQRSCKRSTLEIYHPFSLCLGVAWSPLQPNLQGHTTTYWPTEDPVSWVQSVSDSGTTNNGYCLSQWVLEREGWFQRNSSLKQHYAPMVSPISLMIPGLNCLSSHYRPSLGYPHSHGWDECEGGGSGVCVGNWIRDSEWQVWNKQCNFQEKKKDGGKYMNQFRMPKFELISFLLGVG